MDTDLQAEFDRFQRDIDYFAAHQDELLARFPEQWVAVYNEQVVGADADFDRLLTHLQEHNVPLGEALIRHVTTKEEILILDGQYE